MELPKRYTPKESEEKWMKYWEGQKTYGFDKDNTDRPIFSIDTPPPTVSGRMHLGHSFMYSQMDFIARFKRMCGYNLFYPFGTDDNGLATERLVERLKNVRSKEMSRDEFVKLCLTTLDEILPSFVKDWKRLGISCDWSVYYTTIGDHARGISQKRFLELLDKGRAYRKDAPAMWCPECQTGISQTECKDKELTSYFNDIVFKIDGKDVVIATTRPELLPACVAVFFHPDDKRYSELEGKGAKVPLFNFEVPVMKDKRVDPEKGTGIVMCCTFGDQTDMEWQKAYDLPIKTAFTPDGRMTEIAGKYKGMSIKEARRAMISDMKEQGLLKGHKQIVHTVNVHERCNTEIEFLKTKQWFIRYLDLKDDMLKWGSELNWHPEHMKVRYDNWVKGLQWDWLISRQRHFGIPFPLWYCDDCGEVIPANEDSLPVDPVKDNPPVDKCPSCGSTNIIPEKDVMDTWATSSLTPQLAIDLMKGSKNYDKLFPMDLRPQAHDIITFWLFNTVVRSQMHYGVNPWSDVTISGFVLDPKRKKMSKSKGNVVEPQTAIERYSADALRFWAAGVKLGDDLQYQEKDLMTGVKTTTKLWNASRFAIMNLNDFDMKRPENLLPMDRWILASFNELAKTAKEEFENYNYSRAKHETEKFFWQTLCDNYLEICKTRLYGDNEEEKRSAQYALYNVVLGVLKLFAPIMPFITEEIYHLYFKKHDGKESIHISAFPEWRDEWNFKNERENGDEFVRILEQVRKYKSDNKMSLKEGLKRIIVKTEKYLNSFVNDLKSVTKVDEIVFEKGDFSVEIMKR